LSRPSAVCSSSVGDSHDGANPNTSSPGALTTRSPTTSSAVAPAIRTYASVPSGENDGPYSDAPAGAVTTRDVVPDARSSTSIAVLSTV
jgi:hypothetical protein